MESDESKKLAEELKARRPETKLRQCLGHDCTRSFESPYPGLCARCKKVLGHNWKSPVIEHGIIGFGIAPVRNIKIREGANG